MNKICLQIILTSNGLSPILTLPEEGGSWTKKAGDVRDILKLYDTADESKFAMFMSFRETGTYITIARAIAGRGGDNVSAWLYIPNDIEVEGDKIQKLIDELKSQLPRTRLDGNKLKDIFVETYPQTIATRYSAYNGVEKVYAKRETVYYSLKEIVGVKRYQQYYANYSAILLVTDDSYPVKDQSVKDISEKDLKETIVFCPPLQNKKGISLYIKQKGQEATPFTSPILIEKGTTLDLQLKRDGFKPIDFKDTATKNGQTCRLPEILPWEFIVTRDMFSILAHVDGKNINDATITINDNLLNRQVLIPEENLGKVKVSVSASGYESMERKVDFKKERLFKIPLHRETKKSTWKVTLINGKDGEITISSKDLPNVNESPLKGYSVSPFEGELEYTNYGVWKQRFYGFLAAVAVLIVVLSCVAVGEWLDSHTFSWRFAWPPLEIREIGVSTHDEYQDTNTPDVGQSEETEEIAPIDQAIEYLDNNDTWARDSLIKYQELYGLFEELNSYEFDKLKKREGALQKSSQYIELLSAIKQNEDKQFSGEYNKPNDYEITISRYIEKLYSHAPESASTPSETMPNAPTNSNTDSEKNEPSDKSKEKKKKIDQNDLN